MDSSFNLAVHALICLSHSGRSLSSEALAENICTNPTRVRRVLAGLKKAGMVETREGLDGGYRLTADPATLSLRHAKCCSGSIPLILSIVLLIFSLTFDLQIMSM